MNKYQEDEIGGSCGMYEGEDKCIEGLVGKSKGKRHLEDLGIDRILLN